MTQRTGERKEKGRKRRRGIYADVLSCEEMQDYMQRVHERHVGAGKFEQ